MQDIKELGRRAGDQTLFAEKVRDMLQHLYIDLGLEDELEQDDDQDQQQKDEADDDSSGTQTDGEESAEAPHSMDGEDREGDPTESAEPQAADPRSEEHTSALQYLMRNYDDGNCFTYKQNS